MTETKSMTPCPLIIRSLIFFFFNFMKCSCFVKDLNSCFALLNRDVSAPLKQTGILRDSGHEVFLRCFYHVKHFELHFLPVKGLCRLIN